MPEITPLDMPARKPAPHGRHRSRKPAGTPRDTRTPAERYMAGRQADARAHGYHGPLTREELAAQTAQRYRDAQAVSLLRALFAPDLRDCH